jgi:site-specific recombinase XerD
MLSLSSLRDSWARHLRARNLSPSTLAVYLSSLDDLDRFLDPDHGDITRADVERYISGLFERKCSPATASVRFRSSQQFFRWTEAEGEVSVSPMAKASKPILPETLPRVHSDDELRRLLAACSGKRFEDRRDRAPFLVFLDTGARLSEVANIELEDLHLDAGIIRVTGKGRRSRLVSLGATTVAALDRYLRARRQHRFASSPRLWLSQRGPLSASGVKLATTRRARRAGLADVHPHAFRHTMAHNLKAAGAADEIVMSLGGWHSSRVMQSYGRTLASERALAAHKATVAR